MNWYYLLLAILFDVAGTTSMKLSIGFSRLIPSLAVVVSYILCFAFFTLALKKMETSTAYAIWSGLGTAIIALVGVVVFKESFDLTKLISIILIILGVIGLNLSV
ncbi:MAG: multidrug efflux SMR transporter [Bacteroidia bacterium]|nr:multidrug efflux SMR transporter [Bacteroidia bacterium]